MVVDQLSATCVYVMSSGLLIWSAEILVKMTLTALAITRAQKIPFPASGFILFIYLFVLNY